VAFDMGTFINEVNKMIIEEYVCRLAIQKTDRERERERERET
jgi:hypothetical protein